MVLLGRCYFGNDGNSLTNSTKSMPASIKERQHPDGCIGWGDCAAA
jgi:hypothetical protein